MQLKLRLFTLLLFAGTLMANPQDVPSIVDFTSDMKAYEGYFPFYWDAEKGKIFVEIKQLEEEFLYVNSLSAGIGSNDIGLDRG
ncbi:MAG: DUF5118 domain-containing protein, partial [Bacteroidota bacterium]